MALTWVRNTRDLLSSMGKRPRRVSVSVSESLRLHTSLLYGDASTGIDGGIDGVIDGGIDGGGAGILFSDDVTLYEGVSVSESLSVVKIPA